MPYAAPDYQKHYQAAYRASHVEDRRAYQRAYYQVHRDKMLAKGARYRAWRAALAHAGFTSAA